MPEITSLDARKIRAVDNIFERLKVNDLRYEGRESDSPHVQYIVEELLNIYGYKA